ncbi:MAG: glycosyltransferase [Acinetobacter baumannii]
MASICLNMIVRNEAHVIIQTLKNICQHIPINYWVISDTGSTDNTAQLIQDFFKEQQIPGELLFHPWINFAENRNHALSACADKSDYVLFFDADDYFEGDFKLPELNCDAYDFQMSNCSKRLRYHRKLLIKNNYGFQWRGILHEFIESPNRITTGMITGNYLIVSGHLSHRNQDPDKYLKDAQILEQAFYQGKDVDLLARYAFYCAQSYQDYGSTNKAIYWYKKRIEMQSGCQDEQYLSYMQLGLLHESYKNIQDALYYWQCGIALDPLRAECWYHLARWHSWNGNFSLAYCLSKLGSQIQKPVGSRLSIQHSIYDYLCLYEWCLNAYRLDKIEDSYTAFKLLVAQCPSDLIDRISHQISTYTHLILKDAFQEVQALHKHLTRQGKEHLIQITLR